jgi:hypothetical protein
VELVGQKSSEAEWCRGQLYVPPLAWPDHEHQDDGSSAANGSVSRARSSPEKLDQPRTALLDRFVFQATPNNIKPVGKHTPRSPTVLPVVRSIATAPAPLGLSEDMPLGGTTPASCRGNYQALAKSLSYRIARVTSNRRASPSSFGGTWTTRGVLGD